MFRFVWFLERALVCVAMLWFNLAAGSKALGSCSPTPPLPPSGMGRRKWEKGETHGLRYRQFNKTTKELLTLKTIVIINMQNKLRTIQFSHHQMTKLQSVHEQ